MIIITAPISFLLIALSCLYALFRIRNTKEGFAKKSFRGFFVFLGLYGLLWTVTSTIFWITRNDAVFPLWFDTLQHTILVVGLSFILAYAWRVSTGYSPLFVLIPHYIIGFAGIFLGYIFPATPTWDESIYGLIWQNPYPIIEVFWVLPIALSLCVGAILFIKQAIKLKNEEGSEYLKKRAVFIAAGFLTIAFGAPWRNVFEGPVVAVFTEISLVVGVLLVTAGFVIRNKTLSKEEQ